MPKLQGLIFDLEGTLVNSLPDLIHALNHMLALHSLRPLEENEVKEMAGDGLLTLMQRALNAVGGYNADLEMAYFKEFITRYRTLTPDPAQIYPQVRETLEHYKNAGVKLAVCTNKPTDSTEKLLHNLDLLPLFDFIAGGDRFEVHKPNPGHLSGVIQALGVAHDACVMVGDSGHDLAVARGVGIPCLIMTMAPCVAFHELKADHLLEGFGEIRDRLESLGYQI